MCTPYIRAAVVLERDTLPVMWSDDFRELGISPGVISLLDPPSEDAQAGSA